MKIKDYLFKRCTVLAEQHICLDEKITYRELVDTISKEKKMKEPKFKVGDKVITKNVSEYCVPGIFEGEQAIVEDMRPHDYGLRYISDDTIKWFLPEECLEKVEEPKRYNPLNLKFGEEYVFVSNPKPFKIIGSADWTKRYYYELTCNGLVRVNIASAEELNELMEKGEFMLYSDYLERERIKKQFKYPGLVVGKKYNLSNFSQISPLIFLGYEEDYYKFEGSVNKYVDYVPNYALGKKCYVGEITEYVEPEVELEVGKLYLFNPTEFGPYKYHGVQNNIHHFTQGNNESLRLHGDYLKDYNPIEHQEPEVKLEFGKEYVIADKPSHPHLNNPFKYCVALKNEQQKMNNICLLIEISSA